MQKSSNFAASKNKYRSSDYRMKVEQQTITIIKNYNIMVLVFFSVVLLFSLTLNAIYKVKEYKSDDKTVWEDGDSVCIKEENDQFNISFMQRIA